MIHVSGSCNANFHATGAHCINADTTAFMQFLEGDLFRDFPALRFIIPHGGGAVPYHWGRYRGLADMLHRPPLREHVMRNVYFDTCVYHQPGIDLLFRVIDVAETGKVETGAAGAGHRQLGGARGRAVAHSQAGGAVRILAPEDNALHHRAAPASGAQACPSITRYRWDCWCPARPQGRAPC